MMNTYTKSELIAILNADTAAVRKNHIGNDVLLSMLRVVSDNFTATIERGWKRLPINRGSLAECIVKSVFYGVDNTFKTSQGRKDIDLRGVDKARFGIDTKAKGLEVKFATSVCAASETEPKTKWVLLITPHGVYNVQAENHKGEYTHNAIIDGVKNEILTDLFGITE